MSVKLKESKLVYIFGSNGLLIGVMKSVRKTAELATVLPQAISNASTGKTMTCAGYFFRTDNGKVAVDIYEDLGVLTVQEYDDVAGIVGRSYPKAREISGKRYISFSNKKITKGKSK